jgi:site-specific recombinase XerD
MSVSSRGIRSTLSDDEVELLLAQVSGDDRLAVRDRAILRVFLSTGLRVPELVALNLSDLGSRGGIRVGGRAPRTVSLDEAAHDAVLDWLGRREDMGEPKSDALFVSLGGRRIADRTVLGRVRKHVRAAGLGNANAFTLRNTMARRLLEHGAGTDEVKKLLGLRRLRSAWYGIVDDEPGPNHCIDCGVEVARRSVRCRSCAVKANWKTPGFRRKWRKARFGGI